MSNCTNEELPSDFNSEASVDYYVTTVNEQTSKRTDAPRVPKQETTPIVVSVDGAGSVKVRMRKKSKRRKKKSNFASDENSFFISDDGTLRRSSGSDVDPSKIPRRSSSVCESDLRRNSENRALRSKALNQNGTELPEKTSRKQQSLVRRRSKKRSSIKNYRRRGVILDDINLLSGSISLGIDDQNSDLKRKSPAMKMKQWQSVDAAETAVSDKQMNRQDALAKLNAFMVDVEKATSVAKKIEGERKKDSTLRRSRSLNELLAEEGVNEDDYLNPNIFAMSQSKPTTPNPALYSHQKSSSIDQQSAMSGSVFVSEQDLFIDNSTNQHRFLGKTISDEMRSGGERLVESPHKRVLGKQNYPRAHSDANDQGGSSQSSFKKAQEHNYGLTHLNQICKLFEQIGELRKQKAALLKRVDDLEAEVMSLKNGKDSFAFELNHLDACANAAITKRYPAVDRFKDALSRTSRKISFEKHEPGRISNPMMIGSPPEQADKYSFFPSLSGVSQNRGSSLKPNEPRRKKPLYSRDDLDLFAKGKFKFWKAPPRAVGEQQTAKELVLSSIKAQHSQGTAVHLKSASVTLDRLLNNVDDEFSRKLVEWETATRSRAASRASESAVDLGSRPNLTSSSTLSPPFDDNLVNARLKVLRATDDKSVLGRKGGNTTTENSTNQNMSTSGRSRSYDRMNKTELQENVEMPHPRSMSASADFHKSLPSVAPGTSISFLKKPRHVRTRSSVEWKGLQEAFPTKLPKPHSTLRSNGTGHFRKKKKTETRNTWAPFKFEGRFYLPGAADFTHKSNLELASSISDQFTFKLDEKDVEAVAKPGHTQQEVVENKTKTIVTKEKLKNPSKVDDFSKSKGNHRFSSLAVRSDRGARFFRRSHRVEILRLSSCEVLASSPTMVPLTEEPDSANFSRSLPDLQKHSSLHPGDKDDASDGVRRYTVTIVDLQKNDKKKLEATQSAPSNLEKPSQVNGDMKKPPVIRSTSYRPPDENDHYVDMSPRKKWVTKSLLNSRRNDAVVSVPGQLVPVRFRLSNSDRSQLPPVVQKPKTKPGKLFNRFGKMSPKSRSNSFQSHKEDSVESSPTAKPMKKKQSRFFSFRSGSPLISPKKKVSDFNDNPSPSPDDSSALQIIAFDDSDDTTMGNGGHFKSNLKRKPSSKIVEISERLTDDVSVSSRNQPSPTPISKGIVSRLSKRFVRTDKEKENKKKSSISGLYSKNTNFYTVKNRFEKRTSSDTKTSTLPRLSPSNQNSVKSTTPPCERKVS